MRRFAGVCAASPAPVRTRRFVGVYAQAARLFDEPMGVYDPFADTAPIYTVEGVTIDPDHFIVPPEYLANPWEWVTMTRERRAQITEKFDLQPGDAVIDRDGLRVPLPYRNDLGGAWNRMAKATRRSVSEGDDAFREKYEAAKPADRQKPYSTQYAVDWGKKQGWKVIDREAFNFMTKRHHDCELGMDVIFDDGEGRIGVQAAGKGERKAHYDRFVQRGGVETARRRAIRILYVVFERGNKTPIETEVWA